MARGASPTSAPALSISAVAICAVLWWVISDGEASSWIIGVPTVLVAARAATRLGIGAGVRFSGWGLVRFVPLFLAESLRGGVDVARRTLGPRLQVQPDFLQYRTRLEGASARVFFMGCMNLLPGTLAADLDGDRLEVHVLATESDPISEVRRLEVAVARLFSQSLGDSV
jgi:multicomponent Na+:H+ antiporter subunit E